MIKQRFNDKWYFQVGDGGTLSAMGQASEKKEVSLPHDASIETPRDPQEKTGAGNGFFCEGNYIYTKEWFFESDAKPKKIFLEFEGIYQNAFVYVNHAFAGKCPYGYSNFFVDATDFLNPGEINQIKVLVRNDLPSGRWYTGGGIYRNVNLILGDDLYIVPEGTRLSSKEADSDMAVIEAAIPIRYEGTAVREIKLVAELYDADGSTVSRSEMSVTALRNLDSVYRLTLYVRKPELWDADHPYLYTYKTTIFEKGQMIDEDTGSFGIRILNLDPERGLRINGKTIKLRGGCIHHDNGILGTADFPHAADIKIQRLKEAGFNAIRSAHYPVSRTVLDACDRIGMYVMDEYSDVWTTTKVPFDYGIHMTEWWKQDIRSMVYKDYNHPSVIMYSIGNEIPETGNKFDVQWGKKLADEVRRLDSRRYVTNCINLLLSGMDKLGEMASQMGGVSPVEKTDESAGEINTMMTDLGGLMAMITTNPDFGEIVDEAAGQVDIAGYNYAAQRYGLEGKLHPGRILLGSETYSGDLDYNWEQVMKYPYVLGDFNWTAWDYLGENGIGYITYGEESSAMYAPFPFKAAYCGDINLTGDRRPVSYWREIIWGLRDKPYIAVRPPEHYGKQQNRTGWCFTDAVRSWNWKGYEGKKIEVEVYADGDEAALYMNDSFIERRKVGLEKKAVTVFETVYQPGKIETVVYKNGRETGRDEILTASDDVRICAAADSETLSANGDDIIYIPIMLVDENGTLNHDNIKKINIEIDGPAVLAGFGSADPKSEENYFDYSVRTYEGRLLAAIRGNGNQGDVIVKLSSDGITGQSIKLKAV